MENVKKHSILSIILRCILIFFIVLIILAAVIFIWQKDNILSAYKGITLSSEEIAEEISQSKATVNEVLAEYDTPVLRDFTLEEEEMIRKGELTVEEAVNLILKESENGGSSGQTDVSGESGETSDLSGDENSGSASGSNSDTSSVDQSALVGNAVKQLYSLKAFYIGRLGSLESEAKAEYMSLPADQRGKTAISSIASSYVGKAGGLESECDSQVAGLLSQLKSDLQSIGADTSIVSTLETQYQNEKNLRKSYYVSTYLN